MAGKNSGSPKLHEVEPRENVGRETIARYQAQFRGAAFECLSLLEDEALDRVYCDYQDDFVSRLNVDGNHVYNFFQVKTKGKLNYQWSVNDVFGIRKGAKTCEPAKIADSYAGKLLIHTIRFKNSCSNVVFLTNVHLNDDLEGLRDAIQDNSDNNYYKLLLENFNDALSPEAPIENQDIIERIKKLQLKSNISYLNPHDDKFFSEAREIIYQYSEIDLQRSECEEILNSLISLVERKSFGKLLEEIGEEDLDDIAGVSLVEMLDILSISKAAYQSLRNGGDSQAIKNASIIHRLMSKAGASERMIEFVSDCKVQWDIWFRDKRHTIPEFDLNFILEEIESNAADWVKSGESLSILQSQINKVLSTLDDNDLSATLDRNLLLGAVFSFLVRGNA
ncbi:dsDNA nuclease domain-containing protein [Zooshikella sp. RANM57]|uniref:dsDNA nuclease domain-containing protein n=1 Tax=Zooshikella sp. RANM57 TaxID=3425863 RepID=UPI003D6F596E